MRGLGMWKIVGTGFVLPPVHNVSAVRRWRLPRMNGPAARSKLCGAMGVWGRGWEGGQLPLKPDRQQLSLAGHSTMCLAKHETCLAFMQHILQQPAGLACSSQPREDGAASLALPGGLS